jgi:hypothetical protein
MRAIMNLRKKIIDLEKKVGEVRVIDDFEEFIRRNGGNLSMVVFYCLNYFEQYGRFPPDMPEKAKSMFLQDDEEDIENLC